ncbi:hypothetical protein BDR26DRAFT_861946 [Obelidium mucronatum]|nr:hypothetical protein BDR26DRAFT_861946 [Obelidium mucronatum]
MPEAGFEKLADTSSILTAAQEIPDPCPSRLQITQKDGTVFFTDAATNLPVFTLTLPNIPDAWYNLPTESLLKAPPVLDTFDHAAPDLILSDNFGAAAISLSPYKHDVRRYGYKMATRSDGEIDNSFPLDEGKNVYGLGLFTTSRGKYQWLVNEFVNGRLQEPMSLKDNNVQFKLYFSKATKHANATSETKKFLNSLMSGGTTLGTSIVRKVVATFVCTKTDTGVTGVLDHRGEWADDEEAAVVLSSAVAALLAYKYRVQRYQHKKNKGEFY